jgi:hypothetical protein
MTTHSKTLSNIWTVISRETGEIKDWLKPYAAKVAGLILVALVVAGTAITLAAPLLAHPDGLAGYMAALLNSFCAPGTACEFHQIYPPFGLMVLVFATTCTLLAIIVHMYAHRYDPSIDDMDTVGKATLSKLEEIEKLLNINMDEETLDIRLKQNGTREG